MVSHDVALKNYSNKIIRMYDGKVHSVQVVDEDTRMVHYDRLAETVRRIEEGFSDGVNVREGTKDIAGENEDTTTQDDMESR